jgi:hypothetical protein
MNQSVTHAAHIQPSDLRQLDTPLGADFACRFTDDLYSTNQRELQHLIGVNVSTFASRNKNKC